MKRIKDFKNHSENDINIIVKKVKNDCDPMGETLYNGILGECPEELDDLKIDIVSRSLGAAQKGETLFYLEHIDTTSEWRR